MSPGMMTTATMAYTYNSKKAMRCLGYEAAYRLDEVIFSISIMLKTRAD